MKRNHVNGAVTAALGLTLALSALPVGALAAQSDAATAPQAAATEVATQAEDEVAWKRSGSCEWRVVNRVLTIRPQNGTTGTLGDYGWVHDSQGYYDAIKIEPGVKATTCKGLLSEAVGPCAGLQSIDISGLDTSEATDTSEIYTYSEGSNTWTSNYAQLNEFKTGAGNVGIKAPKVTERFSYIDNPDDGWIPLHAFWANEANEKLDESADVPAIEATYHRTYQLEKSQFKIDLKSEGRTGKPVTKNIKSCYSSSTYKVTYSNNVEPGTATITISGDGVNTVGTLTYHFTIEGGKWMKSSDGWWWQNPDGSYPRSSWKSIGGSWYWFDASGYMVTGWNKIGGSWYLFDSSGAMKTGWQKVGGSWYYLDESSGAMRTGWQEIDGSWYYLDKSGVMQTDWQKVSGSWYYLNGSGVMRTGWTKVGGSWYYLGSKGAMKTGWQKVEGSWYYLNGSGVMQTGWQKIDSSWYYFSGSGVMQTGWLKRGGEWYYFDSNGAMHTGWKQIGDDWYWFDASGVMGHDCYADGYGLGHDGKWLPWVAFPLA